MLNRPRDPSHVASGTRGNCEPCDHSVVTKWLCESLVRGSNHTVPVVTEYRAGSLRHVTMMHRVHWVTCVLCRHRSLRLLYELPDIWNLKDNFYLSVRSSFYFYTSLSNSNEGFNLNATALLTKYKIKHFNTNYTICSSRRTFWKILECWKIFIWCIISIGPAIRRPHHSLACGGHWSWRPPEVDPVSLSFGATPSLWDYTGQTHA